MSSRATAEEIAQDTWGNVLASLDRFEGRSSLRTWIFRICTNRAKTLAVREARSTPPSELEQPGEVPVESSRFNAGGTWADPPHAWTDDTPERVLDRAQAVEQMQRTLAELPAMQRAVITLRDVRGLIPWKRVTPLISASPINGSCSTGRGRGYGALEHLYAEGKSCEC